MRAKYSGKLVTVYRSLNRGDIIGTWKEYAHLPYLQCTILPVKAPVINATFL
jgi:NADPH:quinone reductase